MRTILFKLIYFIYLLIHTTHTIICSFLQFIYYSYCYPVRDVYTLASAIKKIKKKPQIVTIVADFEEAKPTELIKGIENLQDICKIILLSIPHCACNLHVSPKGLQEIKTDFEYKFCQTKLVTNYFEDFDKMQSIRKQTPLVISFAQYNTICDCPPALLIGAEIAFNQSVWKFQTYQILSCFNQYSNAQQRKGK